jgi:adhesin transport system outer membrane protein
LGRSWPCRFGVALILAIASLRLAAAEPLLSELAGLLETNPEIKARQHAVDSAREGISKAYAGYLPKLEAKAAVGPQYIKSPLAGSDDGSGSYSSVAEVAGATLTQNVFDGFATPAAVRGARLNVEVAEYALAGVRQTVLLDGIKAYIEVLRQRQLLALARDSERTIMRQLNLEDERVQRGAGIAVDVLQAKSRLQLAKDRRVAYEGGLADAIARYIQVFDHPPATERLQEPLPPLALLPADVNQAEEIPREKNPVVDSSLGTLEVARERQRLARADYYPRIDIVGSASRETDNGLVRGTQVDMSVLLQTTWTLFNGFATDASVGQATADYRAALRNHDTVVRKVSETTRLAWNEWQTTQQRVELLDNAVNIAAEVFDARAKLREAGRETIINVLDAENEVYNARINLVQARGEATIAVFKVLQGIGRLDRADLQLPEP